MLDNQPINRKQITKRKIACLPEAYVTLEEVTLPPNRPRQNGMLDGFNEDEAKHSLCPTFRPVLPAPKLVRKKA